jgi:hypothetical protein
MIKLSVPATLSLAVLGSVRTIRDYTEGGGFLVPRIQDAIVTTALGGEKGGFSFSRTWLDNKTTISLDFIPTASGPGHQIQLDNQTLRFDAGAYRFSAHLDYPQPAHLSPRVVFNPDSQGLFHEQPDDAKSLVFLSYPNELLAGSWRFLTYFGRDTVISLLLLYPVLSEAAGGIIEAGIGSVIQRVNQTDGRVCHEEVIGDYATYLNEMMNISGNAPQYDYKMVDLDFFLPVVLAQYLLHSPNSMSRTFEFLSRTLSPNSKPPQISYADLLLRNAERVIAQAAPFAAEGNQTLENLVRLNEGETVGNWRDSPFGIGGGRIPYDVNTALVPAALRSIAALTRAGIFPHHSEWGTLADNYAQIWEDHTLQFFEVRVSEDDAKRLLAAYVHRSNFTGPDEIDSVDGDVVFYALALADEISGAKIQVMNSDDCFRHFLLNTTNQPQLTKFINQTANNIRRNFPAGLITDVGVVVANPSYGTDPSYARNFTASDYHGIVVWSWQLAMMARGLDLQLSRCAEADPPDFCADATVHGNVKLAYRRLWDTVEANRNHLSSEVWSWVYQDHRFQFTPLGMTRNSQTGRLSGYLVTDKD